MMTSAIVLSCLLAGQTPAKAPATPTVGSRYATDPTTSPPATAPPAKTTQPGLPAETETPKAGNVGSTFSGQPADTPTTTNPAANPVTDPAESTPEKTDPGAPLVPVKPSQAEEAAEALLRRAMTLAEDEAIPGRKIGIVELLIAKAFAQQSDVERVQSYWRLCEAIGIYHFALEQEEELNRLATVQTAPPLALRAAMADARVDVQAGRLAVIRAQHALAERMALPVNVALPLPSDRPLVGAYRTLYEEIFTGRNIPPAEHRQARRIHDSLPVLYELIAARAAAVGIAEDQFVATVAALDEGRGGLAEALRQHQTLRDERLGFLQAVRDYNLEIAQYALLAARDGAVQSDLVPMLIKTPAAPAVPNAFPQPPLGSLRPLGTPTPATPPAGDRSGVVQTGGESPLSEDGTVSPAVPNVLRQGRPLRSVVVPPSGDR